MACVIQYIRELSVPLPGRTERRAIQVAKHRTFAMLSRKVFFIAKKTPGHLEAMLHGVGSSSNSPNRCISLY